MVRVFFINELRENVWIFPNSIQKMKLGILISRGTEGRITYVIIFFLLLTKKNFTPLTVRLFPISRKSNL
jgi:hypothetical protein